MLKIKSAKQFLLNPVITSPNHSQTKIQTLKISFYFFSHLIANKFLESDFVPEFEDLTEKYTPLKKGRFFLGEKSISIHFFSRTYHQ